MPKKVGDYMEIIRHFDYVSPALSATHVCYRGMEFDGFPLHEHDHYELVYVKHGCVQYTVEGKNYRVESGECFLTRPGVRHTVKLLRKDIYERYIATFDSSLFTPGIWQAIPEDLDVLRVKGFPVPEQLLQHIDYYASQLDRESFDLLLRRTIEELFINFLLLYKNHAEMVNTQKYTANPILLQALEYINENLHTVISLDALSSHLHITKGYLHQLFVTNLQTSPKKYILTTQLGGARAAIRAGGKPTAVYSDWGFQDYCSFYRNYRKIFGYSPSEEFLHTPPRSNYL